MITYSNYSASSCDWIDKIPSDWRAQRIKSLLGLRDERNYKPLNEVNLISLYTGLGVRQHKDIEHTTGNKARNADGYKVVYPDDIVVNILLCWMGAIGRSAYYGVTSPAYDIYRPKTLEVNTQYYNYLMRTPMFAQQCYRAGKGIMAMRWRTYSPQFSNIVVPVPPREEQDQIVRFLDWKVSSINKLINIRKRQIEELEELKRSSIGQLVMGQAQSLPQKGTAISWVKTIPDHWDEKSLIQVAEEQQIKNTGMIEDNLLSLSYGKIINKDINTTDGLLPASFEGYQIVHDGNVILRLTDLQNDHKSLRTGLATQTGIITSAYTCLKARHNVLPEYLQLQLHVADLCKVFYGMGGGVRQSIGFKEIRKLIVAIPPIDEQEHILACVHDIEKPINCAIQKNRDIIAELEDLKVRLISDAVTGKIDVSGIEIPEYEFVEESADADAEDDGEEATGEQED